MASRLETIPYDILLRIAFLTASASVFKPPTDLSNLLLTSRSLYRELNPTNSPHLYSQLFRHQFNAPSSLRSPFSMTDSALALEYTSRQYLLRRFCLRDWPMEHLLADLWIALRICLESEGLNEMQLSAVKFIDGLLILARIHLPDNHTMSSRNASRELKFLLVWLISLTLSREDVVDTPQAVREELCKLFHHFATAKPIPRSPRQEVLFSDLLFPLQLGTIISHAERGLTLTQEWISAIDARFAAVNVIFAMKEGNTLLIPPHLPETRAIATFQQTTGPTMEDFREFQSYRTPLFADAVPRLLDASFTIPGRSRSHDLEFHHACGLGESGASVPYHAGMFSGLWQGSYMIEALVSISAIGQDLYSGRQPLQGVFTEYNCFAPDTPLPSSNDASDLTVLPTRSEEVDLMQGFQIAGNRYPYEKHETTVEEKNVPLSQPLWRKSRHILDTILFGETTDDHDQAWKGFRYVGRVQRNGMVFLKREPKNPSEDYLGTWIFEGKLRFGKVLIGRWRAQNSTDTQGARGIFSMAKVDESS